MTNRNTYTATLDARDFLGNYLSKEDLPEERTVRIVDLVAEDMPGRVLHDALLETRPVKTIPSYGNMGGATEPSARSPLEEDIRRELEALGYIQ